MISNAVKELKDRKAQIASEISVLEAEAAKINQALAILSGSVVGSPVVVAAPGKRTMSAAGRKAIADAARARWAKIKAGKAPVATSAVKPAKKSKMSELG